MELNALFGQNFCTTKAGLSVTGGAANTVATANAILACIGGKAISVASGAGQTTPTVDAVTGAAITLAASQARMVVWCYNAAGALKVVAGPVTSWDGTSFGTTSGAAAPLFPDIPDTLVPFAYQILKASSAAGALTFGTSNWNATGFTNAIVDVMVLPARPQTS